VGFPARQKQCKSPGSAEAKCKNHRQKCSVAGLIFDTQVIRPYSSAVCSSQTSNKPNVLIVQMSTCYSTSSPQKLKPRPAMTTRRTVGRNSKTIFGQERNASVGTSPRATFHVSKTHHLPEMAPLRLPPTNVCLPVRQSAIGGCAYSER
jgi:hypothetical protein